MPGGVRVVFIRFVIDDLDRGSGKRQGLFHAAEWLRESPALAPDAREQLERIGAWFDQNLKRPARLAMSRRPHRKPQALSWFKDTATAHLAKMREFQNALESCGQAVEVIKTRRVGYVVYWDEFQVVACPFRDTPA
jgi:hypothetical protein